MTDPVMIQSGQTYQRDIIVRYFDIQEDRAKQLREEQGDEFDEENFYKCPHTRKVVDRNWMRENKRIKLAVEEFVRNNPWAHDYYRDCKIKDIPFMPTMK